jgi:DNA-binding transcriptional ArsR family regulator
MTRCLSQSGSGRTRDRGLRPVVNAPAGLRDCASNEMIAAMDTALRSETDRKRTATIARALADPKRLCVLEQLAGGERSVSDLSRDAGCQVPNMSQHLGVLRAAGLVASRREGSTVLYRLTDDRVIDAYRLLQQVAG